MVAGWLTNTNEGESRQKSAFVLGPLPFAYAHALVCMCGACLLVLVVAFRLSCGKVIERGAHTPSPGPLPPFIRCSFVFGSILWIGIRLSIEYRHVGLPWCCYHAGLAHTTVLPTVGKCLLPSIG